MSWTREQAIDLCIAIEAVAPAFGCHVALTGGLLYKSGERKDCDLVFYRVRQVEEIDVEGLFRALADIGIKRVTDGECFVIKAKHAAGNIDCLFPEADSGHYIELNPVVGDIATPAKPLPSVAEAQGLPPETWEF